MEELAKQIYQVGLLADMPTADEEATAQTVRALVKGGIYGIILPWNKRIRVTLDGIRTQFPQLLIGVEGPWTEAQNTLNYGARFLIAEQPKGAENAPCFKREKNMLIGPKTQQVLAECSAEIALPGDIKSGNWERITRRARSAVEEMLGFELRHVGINNPDAQTADQVAGKFEQFFNFPKTDKGGAFFAGSYIESMKKPFYGTHGHIAIATPNPTRAAWYLQQRGAVFNWESAGYNEDGSLRVVYLKDEIGGFAVHIVQK